MPLGDGVAERADADDSTIRAMNCCNYTPCSDGMYSQHLLCQRLLTGLTCEWRFLLPGFQLARYPCAGHTGILLSLHFVLRRLTI